MIVSYPVGNVVGILIVIHLAIFCKMVSGAIIVGDE